MQVQRRLAFASEQLSASASRCVSQGHLVRLRFSSTSVAEVTFKWISSLAGALQAINTRDCVEAAAFPS